MQVWTGKLAGKKRKTQVATGQKYEQQEPNNEPKQRDQGRKTNSQPEPILTRDLCQKAGLVKAHDQFLHSWVKLWVLGFREPVLLNSGSVTMTTHAVKQPELLLLFKLRPSDCYLEVSDMWCPVLKELIDIDVIPRLFYVWAFPFFFTIHNLSKLNTQASDWWVKPLTLLQVVGVWVPVKAPDATCLLFC